ncbi:MAG: hypothetical protein Q8P57_04645 [Candidatus Pacearchaeota archaeon]|nr:hypothetical protein [Candidatus Pacearchaeota archaeon]
MKLTWIIKPLNWIRKYYNKNKEKIHYSFYWLKNKQMEADLFFLCDSEITIDSNFIKTFKSKTKNVKHASEGKNYISFSSPLNYYYRFSFFNKPDKSLKIQINNINLNFRGQENLYKLFNELEEYTQILFKLLNNRTHNIYYILTIKKENEVKSNWNSLKKELEKDFNCEIVLGNDVFKIKSEKPIILQSIINKYFVKSEL